MRNTGLDNVPIAKARERLLASVSFSPGAESVPAARSAGRVTADAVFARHSMPSYPSAAMDGIAVTAEMTRRAAPAEPLILREGRDFDPVNTGDPLPEGRDAVIMIERVRELGAGRVEIRDPSPPWKHVRQAGEDLAAGELVLPARHRIRPVDVGALLAGGLERVSVLTKPRVAIIPTGSEMDPPGTLPQRGRLIEFNGSVFAASMEEWGARADYRGIVADEPGSIRQAVADAAESCDIVLVNAGSSAGTRDYTRDVLAELGEVLVHGVAAHPGKPTVLARVRGKPVLGLPGYPVSAWLSLDWFVPPLIDAWYGCGKRDGERGPISVRLARPVPAKKGAENFIRLGVMSWKGNALAFPLVRGAGVTMSLVTADALLRLPADRASLPAGEETEAERLRPLAAIRRTLWIGGEEDPLLDRLASLVRELHPGWSLKKLPGDGEAGADLPCHGWAQSGETLPAHDSGDGGVFLPLADREWGWLTPPGNPAGVTGADDLRRKGLRLLCPPADSGARRWLESQLRRAGAAAAGGADRTEAAPLKAAACVASGTADVTVGTRAAAEAAGLEFIPAGVLPLGLRIDRAVTESEGGERLLSVLRSPRFQEAVASLAGYRLTRTEQEPERSQKEGTPWMSRARE